MNTEEQPEMLTPDQAAEMLGLTRYRLKIMAAAGEIPFVAYGPYTRRYRRGDLEKVISERLVTRPKPRKRAAAGR